ncbi:zinc finger protein 540-like [Condylostylus longicornis]|uniref:zinc finger protein 540-like n=1 Tax=Condylostylus longicornis TaxID=2530218 RepID=UPI00244E0155|nr:zinc finger protein 540-like [Condylostylus longicornis]
MALPASKIDQILQNFSSSEDDELDQLEDNEELCESDVSDYLLGKKNNIGNKKSNEVMDIFDKEQSELSANESDDEVKVVELKVEPIEIDDSGSEEDILNHGKNLSNEIPKIVKNKRKQKPKQNVENHVPQGEDEKENKEMLKVFKMEEAERSNRKIFNSKRPVPCPVCNKILSRTDNMKSHMEIHNNMCIICNINFELRKDFTEHMKEVHNRVIKAKDICALCDQKFKSRIEYNAHIKNEHGVIIDLVHIDNTRKNRPRVERNLHCKECNIRMKNEQLFMLHMQIHENRKENECVLCNKLFENVDAVLEHYGSFDKNKDDDHYIKMRPFSCHLCVVRYKNRRDLTDHLDVHAGKRRYLCPLCGKQFSKKCNMQTHVKLHDKVYHYCCNKKFRKTIEFETHQRKVHGENNLVCNVCSRSFTRRDNLKAHMQTHLKWICKLCSTNFEFRREFNKHMRDVHNKLKNHICSICGRNFILRYNYNKHMETHNRIKDKCVSCEKEFRNRRDYNAHMRNIHGELINVQRKQNKTNSRVKSNTNFWIMVLPSSKIDKLLQLLSSSEDELEGLDDDEELFEEEEGINDQTTNSTSEKSHQTVELLENVSAKKSSNNKNNDTNVEVKVVELEVEPIVIIDSEVESEQRNSFEKDNDSDFYFKWSENEELEPKEVKKTRRRRKRRKPNDKGENQQNSEKKLKRHVGKYTPRMVKNRPRVDRNLKCNECDQRMKNEQLFMLHMQIHNGRKETECVLCNKNFDNVDGVLEHYASFDKDKKNEHYIKFRPFACHLCVVRYKNRRDLTDHLDIHAGQKKFLCPLCGKQFAKRFNMMTHIKVHEKLNYYCERCNKRFRNIREQETHQRMVHGENKLVCSICNKTFLRRDNLKAHLETHDNECSVCNAKFNTRRDLNQHMRESHDRAKKFACSFCGKEFLLRYNYTKHLESHNRVKDVCNICDKEFRNYRDHAAHMRNIHGVVVEFPKFEEIVCPICNRGFSRRDNMKTHMKTHFKWKCASCNTNFEFRKELNQHMGEVHNRIKKYPCSTCGKVFLLHSELSEHFELYHNSISNNCAICDEEFKNRRDFAAHVKSVHSGTTNARKSIN